MVLNVNLAMWARRLASSWSGPRKPKKPKRRPARLGIPERLEVREMLTAYTVTTLNDVLDDTDGVVSLREALNSANEHAGQDTIKFAPDVNGTINLSLGRLQITDSVTISGNGSSNTVIDAQQASGVIGITTTATAVTLSGLTITGGSSGDQGGGIQDFADHGSTLELDDCFIQGNTSVGTGGGIFFYPSGTLTLTNSKVTGNSTTGDNASGGGIYGFNGGTLTLNQSEITGNTTSGIGSKGGGLYWYAGDATLSGSSMTYNATSGTNAPGGGVFQQHGTLNLDNTFMFVNHTIGDQSPGGGVFMGQDANLNVRNGSSFHYNNTVGQYSNGGAIYSQGGDVTITNSLLRNNFVQGAGSNGGGAAIDTGTLAATDSRFVGNQATGPRGPQGNNFASGGAIYGANGDVTISGSTLWNNVAGTDGGGAFLSHGNLTVVNSTVSGNSAFVGGGLGVLDAHLTVDSSTIAYNRAGNGNYNGGGIGSYNGALTIHNSIIAKNTGDNPDIRIPFDAPVVIQNSLIGDNSGIFIDALQGSATPDANENLIGTGAAPIDPRLTPLDDSQGSTPIHALNSDSPALNLGDNARATALGLTTDQTGQDRIVGSAIDMGSYEVRAPFVMALVRDSNDASPTKALSVDFIISFSEAVTGVAASQFSTIIAGSVVTGAITVAAIDDRNYLVTVSGIDGAGKLGLQFQNDGGVHATATSLPISTSITFPSSDRFVIEERPPLELNSINFANGFTSPIIATSVSFKVTFSDDVSHVSASQFQVVTTGSVTSDAPQITGSGSEYSVTVSGITGEGTLGLNFLDDGTVTRDFDGRHLESASFTGAVFEIVEGTQGDSDLDVGGLRFHVANGGTFSNAGTLNSVTGEVQVGFVPSSGGTFTPLAAVDGTVSVDAGDISFSATGAVKAIIDGTEHTLYTNGIPKISIAALISSHVPTGVGSALSVAGGSFKLTSFGFSASPQPSITLQGSMTLPKGITIAVDGDNSVQISSSGIKLNGASLSLTNSFSVGGVTFSTDNLAVNYNPTGNVFSLTGTAGVTVTDIGNLSVNFSSTGLVINNGVFSSLDATVNGEFNIKGVKFSPTALHFHYDDATQKFTMSGGASVDIAGFDANLGVTFGNDDSPGVVLTNGKLDSLEATVNGQFKVAKVTVAGQGLLLSYAAGTFTFAGKATATIGGIGDVSVEFGKGSEPGMVVDNGSLTSLDMAITAQFQVAKVKVNADELRLHYDAAEDTFAFTGTTSIVIGGISGDQSDNSLSVTLGFDDTPGAVITDGDLESLDISIETTFKVAKASLTAEHLHLYYDASTKTFNLDGKALVQIGGVDGEESGDGISVMFGHDTTPGLVIVDGALSSLAMTVQGQFKVASVNVTVDDLALTYEDGTLTLSGAATLTVGGLGDVNVRFGDDTTPGMVITDGNLTSLDMTITAQFEVAKVKINANHLHITYDAATQAFSLTGTTSIVIAGISGDQSDDSLSVMFGFENTPGLVITHGHLDSVDLTVDTTFSVTKVALSGHHLRLTYDAAANKFTLTGDASLTVAGIEGTQPDQSLSVSFGQAGSPGLVIEDGKLASLDVTVNASFKVASVQIKAIGLKFTYTAATQAFTLTGTTSMTINGIKAGTDNSLAITFGYHNEPGLVIENGALKKLDITLNAVFEVAKVQINATDVRFTYTADTGAFTLSGSAGIKIDGIQGPRSDNSLQVTFGYKDSPGLVITQGTLQSLDITINAQFNVAKVQIKATDLRFTYTAATDTFTLGGSAGIIVNGVQGAGLDQSFSVMFGYHNAPGLVIEQGALKSLDITINAEVNVSRVTLKLTDVRFTYTAATTTFTFAGTAGIVVKNLGADLSITFGYKDINGIQQPGLVITDGTLQKLDMTVNAGFRVANVLQVNVKNLRFTYTANINQFTLSGGVSISPVGLSDLANISATLGDGTNPGIVIQDGELKSLKFKVDAGIKLSALTISGQLSVDYTRATNTILISGGASISVAGIGSLSVKLGDAATGTQGLVIVNGKITKFDMTIMTNLSLAGLTLNGKLVLNYSSSSGIFTATGDVTMNVGAIGNVTAKLGGNGTKGLVITNGSLTSLDMSAKADFSIGPLGMDGSLTMSYQKAGGKFIMYGSANGTFLGQSLFTVDIGNSTTPGLAIANGKLQSLSVTVSGAFTLLGVKLGHVSLTAAYDASLSKYFFKGDASIDLPDFVPDWLAAALGGRTLASIGVELNVIANNNHDSYFQAEAKVFGIDFGFRAQFDGGLTFIGDPVLSAIANGVVDFGNTVKNAFVDGWNWFVALFGPLEAATVYYDPNFNFAFATDPQSVTGADGRFDPVVPAGATTGQLVVVGGLDRSTGITNPLQLTAPYMSKVVSPLTSLVNQLMQQRGLSAPDAIMVVNQSLGIPLSTNLLGQSLGLEASGGDLQSAKSFSREVEVGTVVHEVCSVLSGLSGAPSIEELSTNGFAAISAMIGESGGAPLDLSDPSVIRQIIARTAQSAGLTLDDDIAGHAAAVIAGVNDSIDAIPLDDANSYLNRLLQFQTVAQGSIAPDLVKVGAGELDVATFVTNYTGTALTTRVDGATFGALNLIGPAVAITPIVSQSVGAGEPGTLNFQVFLTSPTSSTQPISVHYATRNQSATVANGDFDQTEGTLTWLPGDVAPKTISIPVHATHSDLTSRFFTVELTDVANAEIANSFAIGDIESSRFATTTTLSSNDTSADFGQPVTFTAAVTNIDAGHSIATDGSVAFYDGDTLLGSALVHAGSATFITDALNGGVHTIHAIYSGLTLATEKYLTSTSNDLEETVGKVSQSITFPSIADVTLGDAPFVIDASASSGLPITFQVVSGAASVNGQVLTLLGPGPVVLQATQAGNEDFLSANAVTQTFTILASATSSSNAAPVAADGTSNTLPGQTAVGQLDADDADNDLLTFALAIEPEHGTVVVDEDGHFEYTADLDFQGIDTFTFFANDGELISNNATVTIVVGAPNLPPVLNASNYSVPENTTAVGTIDASDPESDGLTFGIAGGDDATRFVIDPHTGALTFINAPDFETRADISEDNIYDVIVSVTDGINPAVTQAISVTVTDVNEAPISLALGNRTTSLPEYTDTSSAIHLADIFVADDALGTNVLSLTGADSIHFELVGNSLFLRAGTELDFETKAGYSVLVQVNDASVDDDPDAVSTFTLSVTDVAESAAPVIHAFDTPINYKKNGAPVILDSDATVADADSPDLARGKLTVDVSAHGEAGDQLAVRNEGTGTGQIGVQGGEITFSGMKFASFTGGTNGAPLVVKLNAGSTPAIVQALLRDLVFSSTSSDLANPKTIRVQLNDGLGGVATPASKQVSIVDPPVLNGYQLQKGQIEHSFIRYIDLTFASAQNLDGLISAGKIKLTRYDLLTTKDSAGNNLLSTTGANVSLAGVISHAAGSNRLAFDFGTNGVGGGATSLAGDGYYKLELDLDGDGTFETSRSFYRLLGDVNGDRSVDQADLDAVKGPNNAAYDANGDGKVDSADLLLVTRSKGRRIGNISTDPNS